MLSKYARVAVASLVLGISLAVSATTPQQQVGQGREGGEPRGVKHADLEQRALSGDLGATIGDAGGSAGVAWVGYSVPAVHDGGSMCCHWRDDEGSDRCGVCRLGRRGAYSDDEGSDHVGDDHDDGVLLDEDGRVRVFVRVEDGKISRIQSFSSRCVIDAGGARVAWLREVSGAASAEWLATIVEDRFGGERSDKAVEGALSALAMHDGTAALSLLEEWATGRHPRKLREQAIFWLGAARGAESWTTLVQLVTDAPDRAIRARAVFASYVAKQPGTVDLLIGVARNDDATSVRRSALMWLAQLAGERAIEAIQAALDDPDTDVKRHAVFALSQLPADRGVPLLIAIVRENPNPEVRKQALFWLGQTGDERALELIEELLVGA